MSVKTKSLTKGDIGRMIAAGIEDAPPMKSLLRFGVRFFAENLTEEPSELHRWLSRAVLRLGKVRGKKLNVLAPRGAAKSTWLTLIYPVKCAVEGTEPYIVIIADTATQARLYLESIKEKIEDDEELAADYPRATGRGPTWREDRIVLNNGVMVEALGTRMKLRGRRRGKNRPTLIIVDDPQNDENVESQKRREKDQRWLDRAVLKAGSPRTNVIMAGTALHQRCLVMNALRNPTWESRIFRAIESWPDRMDLWKQWEEIFCDPHNPQAQRDSYMFYLRNRRAMEAGARVMWPERESLYYLMCMRASEGHSSFESEKQNNPLDPESVEWPAHYFEDHIWFDEWPEDLTVKTIACDPSKGDQREAKKGDFSAIVKLARSNDGVLYVDCDMKRRTAEDIVEAYIHHQRTFRADLCGFESNAWQDLLCEDIQEQSKVIGVPVPVVEIYNAVKKIVRIRRLGPYLSRRLFRFKRGSPGAALLVEQLQAFPTGSHDDGPDALEMALRIMIDLFNSQYEDEIWE